jgi:hypothetical protein
VAKKRTFETVHGGRKPDFSVETTLTDEEAIKLLGGYEGQDFNAKCAFAIHTNSKGYRTNPNLLAWAFRKAEEKANPPEALTLNADILSMVACRRPLRGEVDGFPFKVQKCGDRSAYAGMYNITDDGEYPRNKFYGRATKDGEWSPTAITPAAVIKKLTG